MPHRKVNRNQLSGPLVLFPGSLGDVLCCLPALEEIGRLTVGGQVSVAVRGEGLHQVMQPLPFVNSVFSLESGLFAQLFSPSTLISAEARQFFSSFSAIYSWFGHTQPEVRTNLERLTPGPVQSWAFFTGQEACHAGVYYLRCVGSTERRCPSLFIGEAERKWLDDYWAQNGWLPCSRLLLLHPGSGGRKKRWAAEGFVAIAQWWRQQRKGVVIVLLGPAEEGEESQWRHIGQVEHNRSLLQTAALLSRAALYVGNDSGISHLAGAVGARGVVIFGPTQPWQWRPLGGSLIVIHNAAYRTAKPEEAGVALAEIPPETVIAEFIRQGG